MATLARTYNQGLGYHMPASVAVSTPDEGAGQDFRLRPLPFEQVFLYVKKIDNSKVARASDPKARRLCLRFMGSAFLGTLLLVGVLLTAAYGVRAGYKIHLLELKQQRLVNESRMLDVEIESLKNPQRLEALAGQYGLAVPQAAKWELLEPEADESLALSRPLRK